MKEDLNESQRQTKSIHANCLQRFIGGMLIPRNCLG